MIALYADNAILESPLIPAILDDKQDGILRGRDEIKTFLDEGARRRPNPLVRWYRTDVWFSDDGVVADVLQRRGHTAAFSRAAIRRQAQAAYTATAREIDPEVIADSGIVRGKSRQRGKERRMRGNGAKWMARIGGATAGTLIAAVAAMALSQMPASSAEAAVTIPPPALDEAASGASARAVFAGGCFWGVQGVFQHVKGVKAAVSGYAGGDKATAEYQAVGTGTTGHAETVEITRAR